MNKPTKLTWSAVGAGLLLTSVLSPMARGQSSEALMDALVRKGILTEQEAEDIKADISKENKQYNKWIFNKDGLEYKLYGDVRGRYEMFRTENDAPGDSNKPRNRFRYRLRAGITATLNDNFEAGFRMTSGEGVGTFGGDPISGNTTFQDNASKKSIFVDLAYGKWTPINPNNAGPWLVSGTIGKMENPFVVSDMVFDGDYTPEGLALQGGYTFNDMPSLKWNAAYFVLDEINQGASASDDPAMWGTQLRWDANWITDPAQFPKVQSTLGASWLNLSDKESLGNGAVPNIQAGNSRYAVATGSAAAGDLMHDYRPFVFDAGVTLTLEKAPLYPGNFPIRFAGEFMHNPSASNDNDGWWGGVFLGKAGKKRTWELSYRYKHLEADAWYEEFVDSDFGAYYPVAPTGSSLGSGYRSGTGLEGHIVKLAYALSDSVSVGATWFWVEQIDGPSSAAIGKDAETSQHRIQIDAIWKF